MIGAIVVDAASLVVSFHATDVDNFDPGTYTPSHQRNVRFEGNKASTGGGAVWVSSPILFDVRDATFSANEALSGGGVSILSSGSFDQDETVFIGCIFEANSAISGGGLHSTAGNELIHHSSFTSNYAGRNCCPVFPRPWR